MLGSQKNCSNRLPTLGVGFLRLTADCARRLIYCRVDQRSQAQLIKMADASPILR